MKSHEIVWDFDDEDLAKSLQHEIALSHGHLKAAE
jgi:hypothetical protein